MLDALSALDGRYSDKVTELRKFFSEQAFTAYRLHVEIQWLLHLYEWSEQGQILLSFKLSPEQKSYLSKLAHSVLTEATLPQRAKDFERETNHDVKALEYALVEHLSSVGFSKQALCYVHFACTSEDINNLAYALMVKDGLREVLIPKLQAIT